MTTPLQISAPEMGGRRALTLAIMALIFTFVLPAAGLALSIFAIYVAIRDLRALHQARKRAGMATGAVVISSIAFFLGALITISQLYFSAELSSYNECRKGAGTVEAQQDCNDQLIRSFEHKLGVKWLAEIPEPSTLF